MRVSLQAAEGQSEGARAGLVAIDERGMPAHCERISTDQVRRVIGAAASTHVEVGERQLFGTLDRVRRRHGVEAVEVVCVTPGRLARRQRRLRCHDRGPRGDEPSLAGVRVEARLKERLARESLVRHRGEDTVHTRACGGPADS